MAALKPTAFAGEIVWLGLVADRRASLRSQSVEQLEATYEGVIGDCHGGALRRACSRVRALHPRGTPIHNVRQISVLSQEEIGEIAGLLGMEALDPGLLGATMVLRGLPDLSNLPPSSRLQGPAGTTLVIDMQNRPCRLPAREIEAEQAGLGRAFRSAARGRRGITAWVERQGALSLDDRLVLHIPDQPAWTHLDAARRG